MKRKHDTFSRPYAPREAPRVYYVGRKPTKCTFSSESAGLPQDSSCPDPNLHYGGSEVIWPQAIVRALSFVGVHMLLFPVGQQEGTVSRVLSVTTSGIQ